MSLPKSPEYAAEQMNKRRAMRAPLIIEKISCDDGHKTFFGYAKNVSRGGPFIATVKPREPGEEFQIEWTLPTKPKLTVRCRCVVIWKQHLQRGRANEPRMGLRFLDHSDEDRDQV